ALGLILLGADDHRGAALALGNACALDPKDEDSCYLLGRSLYILGKYQDAVKPLETALRAVPAAKLATAHRAIALNFAELEKVEEADRHFRDAVRLYRAADGAQPDPRVDYGAFLTRQGRAREALETLQAALA